MKKSGFLAASMAAASATAISVSSTSSNYVYNTKTQFSHEEATSSKHMDDSSRQISNSTEKFAPRFDGLRFIETLVTAHR